MPRRDEVPEDRVREALTRLGSDSASAPEVPDTVMDRMRSALRAAPPPPAHAAAPGFTRPGRWRLVALIAGIAAAAAAAAVAIATVLHSAPAPRFPSGPTADKITVSRSPDFGRPSVTTRP